MKRGIILLGILLCVSNFVQAQENVADIAHDFMKSVKENNLLHIRKHYLDVKSAYALLPKSSTGLNDEAKHEKYLKPMHDRFEENFKNIQKQITDGNINTQTMELMSYKLEKIDPNAPEAKGKKILPQAMSLFFNYNKKENNFPISVVQIDEKWYILEILISTNNFK